MDRAHNILALLSSTEPRAIQYGMAGSRAFERLLRRAEQQTSGDVVRVVQFISSLYGGQAFSFTPFDFRALDASITDDMLVCLDALRWVGADLHSLVDGGERRVRAVISRRDLQWPAAS